MRLRTLGTRIAVVTLALGASAGLLWAAPKVGAVVTVRVMSAKVMKAPKFIGPTAGAVSRGDNLTVREVKGDWYRVDGAAAGWINRTSVAEGKLVLSSKPGGGSGASRDEVELAGRGFTPDVERQYRTSHPTLDFAHVEAIEEIEVDVAGLSKFVDEGGLGGAP